MPDVFCGNTDKCQMCPKSVENAVFHVFHKQGFHIPVIRSEFNFMLFILKGEILVNSEEYAGTTVKTGEFILQPITAKIEILAMIDTECIYYRFNQPELFCDKRYHPYRLPKILLPVSDKLQLSYLLRATRLKKS